MHVVAKHRRANLARIDTSVETIICMLPAQLYASIPYKVFANHCATLRRLTNLPIGQLYRHRETKNLSLITENVLVVKIGLDAESPPSYLLPCKPDHLVSAGFPLKVFTNADTKYIVKYSYLL